MDYPQTRKEKKPDKDKNKNPYKSKHIRKVEALLNSNTITHSKSSHSS